MYFVKVIPPAGRARVHDAECRHCRHGAGQANQDKGTGPTYWSGPYSDLKAAVAFMDQLGTRYTDTGLCRDCKPGK